MLLTITTTHEPATDLGYLLVKHPDKVHRFALPTGTAYVFYPRADRDRCTAALLLEVDSQRLARPGSEVAYVNDRPYAASSLLAVALAKVFRTAMRGGTKDRPALAAATLPLELAIPVLRCHGGADLADRVFAPLGWTVTASPIPLDPTVPEWGDSRYVDLTLTGTLQLADALHQLYVLLPVLDDAKHYWVAPDEIDKLLRAGEGWLAAHPERRLITERYLVHQRAYADAALARLADSDPDQVDNAVDGSDEDAALPEPVRRQPLAAQRRAAVRAAIAGAGTVLDLGCGSGALLAELLEDPRHRRIVGADVSTRALALAERRLRLDRLPERQRDRVALWQTALTYRDDRLRGFDAAVLMEVIEHVDPPRLPALVDAVFGHAQPEQVVVTTPNVEYNEKYPGLTGLRHPDHRFEWSRATFADWAGTVAVDNDYRVELRGVGEADPVVGAPTQLALFRRGAS